MTKHLSFLYILVLTACAAGAQIKTYTVANAHSHNDYEKEFPFTTAYNAKFGSIEADIFLSNDSLIVGHTTSDLQYKRTLENLYLDPLQQKTRENNGYPYKDTGRYLQLLIDIKTDANATIDKLVQVLSEYPALITSKKILFTITGNRPPAFSFKTYPSYIFFDGDLKYDYPADALEKIVLLSDNLKNYTRWSGKGPIAPKDTAVMYALIRKAHQLGKKIRFWNSPDFAEAWLLLTKAGVDYINTDHIRELSSYLHKYAPVKAN